MRATKEELNHSLFESENQQCLNVISVTDLSKKKKDDRSVYLALAVTTDEGPFVCVIRKSEKTQQYKMKQVEPLREVKQVDARPDDPVRIDITLKSNRTSSYNCDDPSEKHSFLITFYKAILHYFKSSNDAPVLVNFTVPEELAMLKDVPTFQDSNIGQQNDQKYQVICPEEEKELNALMEDWGLRIRDADLLLEMSTRKLSSIDFANISALVNAEEDSLNLLKQLDHVIDDVGELEKSVLSFMERLNSISSAVKTMSAKDVLFEIENNNRNRLERLLEVLISNMSVLNEDIILLEQSEIAMPPDPKLVEVANHALAACQFQLPARLEYSIDGLRNRRADLQGVCKSFAQRAYKVIANSVVERMGVELANFDSELTDLPSHTEMFNHILKSASLVNFVKQCDHALFTQLTKVLKVSLAPIYNREITAFLMNARSAVSQNLFVDSSRAGSLLSVDTLFNKPERSIKRSSSSDPFDLNVNGRNMRVRSSKVAEKVVSQIKDRQSAQQEFFIQFYSMTEGRVFNPSEPDNQFVRQMQEIEPNIFRDSEKEPGETQREDQSQGSMGSSSQYDFRASEDITLWSLMSDVFDGVETELKSLLTYMIKQDQMVCIYVFVTLGDLVGKIKWRNSFIQKMFASLLINVKRQLDAYAKSLVDSILSYRCARNKRIGILPYLNLFHNFVVEAEDVFELSSRKVDLDKIYKSLLDAIQQNLLVVSRESAKTPPDLVLLVHYHRLQHILRKSKVSSIEAEKINVDDMYLSSKASYVNSLVSQALDSIDFFFNVIDQKLEAGVKPDDIQYDNQLSIVELKEIVRKQSWSEIRRRLDSVYGKVQYFMVGDSSLFQVLWHDTQIALINRIGRINQLLSECYPHSNVALDFTDHDVASYFANDNDIAAL